MMRKIVDDIVFEINQISEYQDGINYQVKFMVPEKYGWIDDVYLMIKEGNIERQYPLAYQHKDKGIVYFKGDISLATKAIYRYYFKYTANRIAKTIKNKENDLDTFKMSVNFEQPDWAKGAIMYHIFVDRFKKGREAELTPMPRRVIHKSWNEPMLLGPDKDGIWNNDFYGGDLQGIIDSLDYIKSLGVTILYLSPIVMSQSNHRYDAANYEIVDPYVGVNEDLQRLCEEAHKRDMYVILDAVFNHTGNDSIYFNEYETYPGKGAFHHKDSPYRNFYRTHETNGETHFNYWWGMPNLPVCNGSSKEWIDYITGENGVIDKWCRLGIDGLRLDVADDLTDDFIANIRTAVKRNNNDSLILGEVWKNPMRMNRGYIENGKCMDTIMNYPLVDALIRYYKYGDAFRLDYTIKDMLREYPEGTVKTAMNFTSTHDISRAIEIFSTDSFQENGEWAWRLKNPSLEWCKNHKLSPQELKKGTALYELYLFTLTFFPGIFSIFYGDEVGTEGIGELLNRQPFPWDNINQELLNYFKYLGNIRNKEQFLKTANLNIFDINKDYLLFERAKDNEKVLVAVSRTNEEKKFLIPGEYENGTEAYSLKNSKKRILTPYGGVAIKKKG